MNVHLRRVLSPFVAIGRWFTTDRLIKIREVSTIMTTLLVLYVILSLNGIAQKNRATNKNTADVVKIIEEQTSPEAINRQEQQIKTILVTVDCNTRQAFQDAINQLVANGDLPVNAIELTQACDGPPASGTTTVVVTPSVTTVP